MNVRDALEATLRHPVAETEWDALVRLGFAGEVEGGFMDVDALAAKYRELRDAFRPAPRPDGDVTTPAVPARLNARADAISRCLAALAAEHEPVRRWRERWLPGGLLRAEDVEGWGDDAYNARPFPSGGRGGVRLAWPVLVSDLEGQAEWMEHQVTVHPFGPLAELAELVEKLVEMFSWGAANATLFVLTGKTQFVSPVAFSMKGGWKTLRVADGMVAFAITSRLTIEVDPVMRPEELAALYRQVRASVLPDGYQPQSEKHLELAAFTAEAPEERATPAMRRWNRLFPGWAYDRVSNFSRDRLRAYHRLLMGPRYQVPTATR